MTILQYMATFSIFTSNPKMKLSSFFPPPPPPKKKKTLLKLCILKVNDSATGLLGDSQEEDRRHIADIILAKMEVNFTMCIH